MKNNILFKILNLCKILINNNEVGLVTCFKKLNIYIVP